jgi:hypothetical protein
MDTIFSDPKNESFNRLSYWFPILEKSGVSVPNTILVKAPDELINIIDGNKPEGYSKFIEELKQAAECVGYPCFLRTDHTSNKHDWDAACLIGAPKDFGSHVYNLVEFSECADLIGLSYEIWAVREMLPTEPIFYAFYGHMPVVKEFRCFYIDNEVICVHPYWPPETIQNPEPQENWQEKLETINKLTSKDEAEIRALANKVGLLFNGDWSIDILWTKKGWYVTDMATAETSYHWPECKNIATYRKK